MSSIYLTGKHGSAAINVGGRRPSDPVTKDANTMRAIEERRDFIYACTSAGVDPEYESLKEIAALQCGLAADTTMPLDVVMELLEADRLVCRQRVEWTKEAESLDWSGRVAAAVEDSRNAVREFEAVKVEWLAMQQKFNAAKDRQDTAERHARALSGKQARFDNEHTARMARTAEPGCDDIMDPRNFRMARHVIEQRPVIVDEGARFGFK